MNHNFFKSFAQKFLFLNEGIFFVHVIYQENEARKQTLDQPKNGGSEGN